jgi:hypothetical protein
MVINNRGDSEACLRERYDDLDKEDCAIMFLGSVQAASSLLVIVTCHRSLSARKQTPGSGHKISGPT